MDIFGSDKLNREDFDQVIKAFYNEAAKAIAELEGDKKEGFQEACKVFDNVWNSYKKLQ